MTLYCTVHSSSLADRQRTFLRNALQLNTDNFPHSKTAISFTPRCMRMKWTTRQESTTAMSFAKCLLAGNSPHLMKMSRVCAAAILGRPTGWCLPTANPVEPLGRGWMTCKVECATGILQVISKCVMRGNRRIERQRPSCAARGKRFRPL